MNTKKYAENLSYRSISDELKKIYGSKVYKLSLSSGCTCPNRDGSISYGGCSFCSEGGSGDFAAPFLPLDEQLRLAKEKIEAKLPKNLKEKDRKYIAYFQSFTNTYGDTLRLESLYTEAVNREEIVILSVGTRPDCLEDDKLEMLTRLNKIKPVWVELGLQTIHEATAERINRGYVLPVFEDAYERLTAAGLKVIVHVILGLPGESREDMLGTVSYLAGLSPVLFGIKLQLLHVLKGTRLASEYEAEPFKIMSLEEYAETVVECIKLLPEETIIHRITGDGPKSLLIEPAWSADKKKVLNTLNRKIREAGIK